MKATCSRCAALPFLDHCKVQRAPPLVADRRRPTGIPTAARIQSRTPVSPGNANGSPLNNIPR